MLSIADGTDESLCPDRCGNPLSWTADEQWLLTERGGSIRAIHIGSKRFVDILSKPAARLWQSRLSPNGKTLAFLIGPGGLAIAPFARDKVIPESAWVGVTSGLRDDKPQWSADSRTLYFVSEQDGFRCVWGRRIDTKANEPVGDTFAVYHSHRARRSAKDIPMSAFSLWRARNDLFFIQLEQSGNLWMMERAGQ
jgi:hypothetical protein